MALSLAALQQGLHTVVTPDPVKNLQTLADYKQQQQATQMGDIKLQDAQRQQQEAEAIHQALIEANGDIEAALPLIAQRAPGLFPHYQKIVQDQKQQAGELAVKQGTLDETRRLRTTQEATEKRRTAATDFANKFNLRKQGLQLKTDPITGDITGEFEQVPREQLSAEEASDLDAKEAGVALKKAQAELAAATTDYRKFQSDPTNPQFTQAERRLQIAQQNANTAQERLGLSAANLDIRQAGFERDTYGQYAKIRPVLASVSELADKINTGSGLIAKAKGEAEKVRAKLNYDDDVAEYQSLVQAFTPLWARALGHTGVLTQQDVDSAREALPKPGDSKTLKDRKLARIEKILSGVKEAQESVAGHPGNVTPQTEPDKKRGKFNPATGKVEY